VKVRFLLDENLSPRLKVALLRMNPVIDVVRVGELEAPSLGTLDPEILNYLDLSQRLLVTANRASMPDHLANHWEAGKHIWGVLLIRPRTPLGRLAQDLFLVWESSEAEEWIDTVDWIPF
jgi:hypothetical protein